MMFIDASLPDVLSAAMDSGVAISAVLIFFWYVFSSAVLPNVGPDEYNTIASLQYPKNGTIGGNSLRAWWGQ